MQTKEITIRVTPDAAEIYETASKQEKRKLDALLSIRLSESTNTQRPLEEIMNEASQEAKQRGLTEDKLNTLLTKK